ncbi:MAG: OmpA family protein [Bacteroidetes bacterium]|nr:MAG: OmpA family protein [Bacteroidota bacterium]
MRTFVHPLVSLLLSLFVVLLAATSTGCTSTQKGAAVGAGAGAVVGGVIGHTQGETAKGAVIGAAVGGVAGAVIGRQMDRQAEELEQELEGAEVERVGEGIIITFDSAILFDVDESTLSGQAQRNLDELAESLARYPQTNVLIAGHTDSTGPEEYNLALSERRARSAAAYLIGRGIDPSRITTVGHGETMPVATNDTEAGRQQNRRVEIAIYASEEYREQAAGAGG